MTTVKFPRPILKNSKLLRSSAYVNGKWLNSSSNTFKLNDPASGEVIEELPEQSISELDDAIDVAYETFKTYKYTTPRQRATWLRNMFNAMNNNADDLANIISWENGKAYSEALGEIKYAASYFEWFAEEAPRMYGTTIQPSNPSNKAFTMRQPIGVCGLICPWNFPSAMITRKVAPALAAGCTVVVKPDSQTPLSALALAQLIEESGFPPGVFNVVLSSKNTPEFGARLCESRKVKKVSFTGSTRVGKLLMKQSSSTLKKLSLELGGNAPFIVFEDADLELAVEQAVASKFRGLGQTCVCANRLYVHSSIIDKFAEMLASKVENFVIGPGLDKSSTHGCLINADAVTKVETYTKDAIAKGAKVVVKGGPITKLGPTFYAPCILSHVPQNARVSKEEIFGPLCPIFSFDTLDEVVGYANDTVFGLASYVFSKNINNLMAVSEALENGMVSCNTGLFSDAAIPFGGVDESGFGREGSLHGIEEYTFIKTVILGNLPTK
ncbi:hypothetical protein Kpol_1045p64 [Vanderwaltozyma polyspora DSM 70294]|uniref:Succinate-semialdehyde dehydrogenase n=1 Tax=Vanderwaltozyma polyspora (strain ATCC 22028 / DSM 70294 / BCRC 21397 / CBS 2163 / NBRC 10782 / NRRL Y-8283 / UCD 57-17) TaxID=436907 RepID=A7TI70_VANPO|nr:uncharacterized protein Kpol_1045p64 [Vanderwaltozyma polyspora DSM 70294]EDO18077.1 hypothetical protein Kpol_1045p64 [Vanderwaltozyma polyspora DSM 70294]